ncbi:MAG: hypothetical protein P8016_07495, partial [Sedimentisphaerales bacterium]
MDTGSQGLRLWRSGYQAIRFLCSCFSGYLVTCFTACLLFSTFALAADKAETAGNEDLSALEVQNLHMKGKEAITFQYEPGAHILVFQDGFSLTVRQTEFSSNMAVIWLVQAPENADENSRYTMTGYLQGHVRVKTEGKSVPNIEDSVMPVWFRVNGEVLVTADKKETSDPRGLNLYASAFKMMQSAGIGPTSDEARPLSSEKNQASVSVIQPNELAEPEKEEQEPAFRYPITLAPTGAKGFQLEAQGNIVTVTGGFYLSQKQEIEGEILLLELKANDAVIYLPENEESAAEPNEGASKLDKILASGTIKAIYLCGDVVMTEGQRTIRADEIYYDYEQKKAIIIDAVMRNFDINNGIPIYIRASKIQQLAANKFSAQNATVTTSEFYIPQISLNASSIVVTDNTSIDREKGDETKSSYDVLMRDVSMKYYDTKLPLFFPRVRTNMERPDVPIKNVRVGNDNIFGTYVETSWYTTRLLGLEEPEGTDSTLFLDFYSDRGPGGGIETNYSREDYYGSVSGYMLGRISSRKDLEHPEELRGRFYWQDRHFLPYKWQLTTELSYLSDEHFLESFYRDEYNLKKPPETLIHMKRIEDNWGLSLLAKARINNFENVLEELPSAEFHLTGESFWDDKLTFYSDSQISRLRQRYAEGSTETTGRDFFSFMTTRNEIDLPLSINKTKIVPFIAGTVAFEDELGFYRAIDNTIKPGEDDIFIGELGVRGSTQPFWKVFSGVHSQLWDLNQLRHVIQPHLLAVDYTQNHAVAEQRDVLNVGITQRLQTKRGSGTLERTVDWMRLDTDFTWVNNSSAGTTGADR